MRIFFSGPRFLGVRPGVSFRPEELLGTPPRTTQAKQAGGDLDGSFVYVIRGDHNMTKIGVSTNPDARLAQLRTASPFPIEYAFVGVTPGNGYDIERQAHAMLGNHRVNGEWFDAPPEMAVAAVHGAAFKLNQPIQRLEPWMVAEVIKQSKAIAAGQQPETPRKGMHRMPKLIFSVLGFFGYILLIGATQPPNNVVLISSALFVGSAFLWIVRRPS